jgi:drug/metabolite transporter (DMT)-like permease
MLAEAILDLSRLRIGFHVTPMEPLAPSPRRPPRRPSADPVRASVLAAVAALLFGMTVVAQRALALDDVPALSVIGLRYAIGALLLVVFLAARRQPLVPEAGERLRAVLLGAGGYAVQAVLFYLALGHGSAGTVAMLFYVYPAIVVLIEVVIGRVRPGPLLLLSVLLACAGAAGVVTAGRAVQVTPLGAGLALASAVCIAVYLTVNAGLLPRTRPAVSAAWVSTGTALSTLAVAGLQGIPPLDARQWVWLGVAGGTTGAATACMYAALARASASRVAVLLALQTLVALALGAWLLDEPVGAVHILGVVAILSAVALAGRAQERPVAR